MREIMPQKRKLSLSGVTPELIARIRSERDRELKKDPAKN